MANYIGLHVGHNASVALMINGKIKYCLQEERFAKIKNFCGFPKQSLNFLEKYIKSTKIKIDEIGISTKEINLFLLKYPLNHFFSVEEYHNFYGKDFYGKVLKGKSVSNYIRNLRKDKRFKNYNSIYSKTPDSKILNSFAYYRNITTNYLKKNHPLISNKINYLDHHTCHAYYGRFSIKYINNEKSCVVVIDSYGDRNTETIWIDDGKRNLRNILKNNQCELARIYKFVTLILNMKPDEHEFKVMGMAPYGKKKYYLEIYENVFKNILKLDGLKIVHKKRPKDLYNYLKKKLSNYRFDNVSAALQYYLEKTILELLKKINKRYRINNFYFSGGVSMNVKMYNLFIKEKFIKKLHNAPSGSDESLSMGACYFLNRSKKSLPLNSVSIGSPLIDVSKIEKKLLKYKRKIKIKKNVSHKYIAKLLQKNKIIAIAQGNEEFGARALGNRSIIVNPSDLGNIMKINAKIKNRDFWMPFAITILKQHHKIFIKNPKALESPFMNLSFDTISKNYEKIKAGCHPLDKTVRPQILDQASNKNFFNIINEFYKLTKIPAVLNTSLNLHGYPKSSDLSSVLETFFKSELNYLYLENKILIKKR